MRPAILNPLFADITSLKGVGPRLAALVQKVSGARVIDVLFTRPHAVIDRSFRPKIAEAAIGSLATLEVTVDRHDPPPVKRLPYRVICSDETGFITLIFFNARPDYIATALPEGAKRIISGRIDDYSGARQMTHPDHIVDPAAAGGLPLFEPVYPLTAGLPPSVMRKATQAALARAPQMPEWQDAAFLRANAFPNWNAAISAVHAPRSALDISPQSAPIQRLAYDELLANQLALALIRRARKKAAGRSFAPPGALRKKALAALPFKLTGAQANALKEIDTDLASPDRMVRLVQGDVGSGKTAVAFLAATAVIECGAQTALLAPTEILARQHIETLSPIAAKAGVRIDILTGRDKGQARAEKLRRLKARETDLLIGTHALIQEDVDFADLGLVIIDEQHRFGVNQRAALAAKGWRADMIVMTATPIPRTLALTAYGDMDATAIGEKPPGRKPVDTRAMPIERLDEVVEAISRVIARGEQVYWVCPLVEESDLIPMTAAEERYKHLFGLFGDKVGLVHGRMSAAEKDAVMERFHRGALSLLIATTVIEVGVNAPNAVVMVIEHAERFGLAQLHQLRGRVGRGDKPASCLLLYKGPLNDTATARLKILRETEDGFRIAEEDLRLRGAGDLLGSAQSGFPRLLFADYAVHGELLRAAKDDATMIVDRDHDLKTPRGEALRILLYLFSRDDAIKLLRAG
ncbi:MAG: ATP-dependent DNA helicase RecG [Alphaproteobacteria bacterium RIFCSPHIGHO2_12_FULL_63_12]|nr:MAG: ATP-dependent DNA helicase RecG [Alphaproteobacteria bacterium RIFCSPHIGHO2_12_FULL_63_12]